MGTPINIIDIKMQEVERLTILKKWFETELTTTINKLDEAINELQKAINQNK